MTKTTDTIVPEEIPEISLANTTTPSVNTTTPSVKQGTVLAGFEEEIPNNNSYSTFFTSNISRIVIGSLIAIAVLLVGFVFFKKKKV